MGSPAPVSVATKRARATPTASPRVPTMRRTMSVKVMTTPPTDHRSHGARQLTPLSFPAGEVCRESSPVLPHLPAGSSGSPVDPSNGGVGDGIDGDNGGSES